MSAGKASFAPTSSSFGSRPSDAYFLLESNPPGPVTIDGSMNVLGTLNVSGPTFLGTGTGTRSLSTTGDAFFNGGITVGNSQANAQIVGYDGAAVTTTNIPFGLTVIQPGIAPTTGNSFRVNQAGVLTNLGNVTRASGGDDDVVIPLGQYVLYSAAGQTASDGGVSFSPPAPYAGFVGGRVVGSTLNAENVLVQLDELSGGTIRMVCVTPDGAPSGAGINVSIIALLQMS